MRRDAGKAEIWGMLRLGGVRGAEAWQKQSWQKAFAVASICEAKEDLITAGGLFGKIGRNRFTRGGSRAVSPFRLSLRCAASEWVWAVGRIYPETPH